MDILNNVWTAISTPNIILVNICIAFLILIIEAPLSISLIGNVFNFKFSKVQKITYIVVVGSIGILATFVIKPPYNIILNYSTAFIVLFFVMKMGFIKSIIATVFPSILFNLVVNLIINPYVSLLNITYDQASTIVIYRLLFICLTYSTVFILNSIIKYRKITVTLLEDIDIKSKSIITFNFIFGFFYIIVQGILTVNYIDILPIQFTFFNFICLLIYFSLSFFSLAKIVSLVNTTKKLENAEEYNRTLHILHDSVRGFKHDFDNIVTTIGGYIRTDDMKGLERYYSQLEKDCKRVNNLYILNPDIINNPGIYNLLTTKYNKATESGIQINLTFLLDLNNLNMKIYEFARILGILLDNAIEAASECTEKILNIDFRNDSKNNRNIILIENTYKNKDVDLNTIFNKGFSEKENHTGLGLWEIRQILKKNNNVNLYTTKNEQYFSQQLEIYY